jgi:hypothetical protein
MKRITDKEYTAYQEYKKALIQGRIITPDSLRIICESLGNDPEIIGKYFLTELQKFKQRNLGNTDL